MRRIFDRLPGRRANASVLLVVASLLCVMPAYADISDVHLVFPQVVKGSLGGLDYETLIVITNPGSETVEVTITSDLLAPQSAGEPFSLGPWESRHVPFAGEPFRKGFVELIASGVVNAAGLLRATEETTGAVVEASVPISVLGVRAVVPVFIHSPFAENTGLAFVYWLTGGDVQLRMTLRDSAGNQVATRTERTPFDPTNESSTSTQAAFFVTELFPDLPKDFSQGSLSIEADQVFPEVFAVVALYTKDVRFWTAEVTPIDDIRSYIVRLKPEFTVEAERVAEHVRTTYGAQIDLVSGDVISILATREVARAVSRDPVVRKVLVNSPLTPP